MWPKENKAKFGNRWAAKTARRRGEAGGWGEEEAEEEATDEAEEKEEEKTEEKKANTAPRVFRKWRKKVK